MSGGMTLLDLLASGFLDLYVRLASMVIALPLGVGVLALMSLGERR